MRVELFPFQKRALADIRMKTAEAMGSYHRTHAPQVVSFTAPTGAGKTIIMSALIEAILSVMNSIWSSRMQSSSGFRIRLSERAVKAKDRFLKADKILVAVCYSNGGIL